MGRELGGERGDGTFEKWTNSSDKQPASVAFIRVQLTNEPKPK